MKMDILIIHGDIWEINMEKDKMKRYDELWEKKYEKGLRFTNQECLEFFHLGYELAEEESKKAFYEALEAGDYRT